MAVDMRNLTDAEWRELAKVAHDSFLRCRIDKKQLDEQLDQAVHSMKFTLHLMETTHAEPQLNSDAELD
jgi:hypothetical protein